MEAGKHYFTDKCPFTDLDQLARARKWCRGRLKYMVYYSERLSSECSMLADEIDSPRCDWEGHSGNRVGAIAWASPRRVGLVFKKLNMAEFCVTLARINAKQFLQYAGRP